MEMRGSAGVGIQGTHRRMVSAWDSLCCPASQCPWLSLSALGCCRWHFFFGTVFLWSLQEREWVSPRRGLNYTHSEEPGNVFPTLHTLMDIYVEVNIMKFFSCYLMKEDKWMQYQVRWHNHFRVLLYLYILFTRSKTVYILILIIIYYFLLYFQRSGFFFSERNQRRVFFYFVYWTDSLCIKFQFSFKD